MNRRNKRLALISLVLAIVVVVVVVIFVPPFIEASASNNFESKVLTYVSGGWAGDHEYFTYYNSTHYSTPSPYDELQNYTPAPYLTASDIAILNNYTLVSPSTFLNDLKAAANTMGQATDYGRDMFLFNVTRVVNSFYVQYVSTDNVGFPSIDARCVIYY